MPTEAHSWSLDFLSSVMMTPAEKVGPLQCAFLLYNTIVQNIIMCRYDQVWSKSKGFISLLTDIFEAT